MLPEIHLGAVWNMWNAYGWNSVLWFGGMGLIFKFVFPASFVEYSTIGRHGDERDIMPNLCRHTGSDLGALNAAASNVVELVTWHRR